MVKKSLIWLYSVSTWLLWAIVIVMASVVLSLRYLVLPNIQEHKDTIAQRISQTAGHKVTIGDIRANWHGMQPHLDLFEVNLHDAQGRPALTLDHVETSLSWLSLPLGEVRLASLVIHQPRLTVRREPDGTIFVAGMALGGASRPQLTNWLLRQSSIDVRNASVIWQDDLRQAPPLSLDNLTLHVSSPAWESFNGRHRFGLEATPSAGSSHPITVRGNLLGKDVSKPEQWQGTLYAKTEGTDIAAWRTWVPLPTGLQEGHGATQMWLDLAQGQARKLVADVVLSKVVTKFDAQSPETALDKLSGRLTWQRLADGQQLHAEKLRLSAAGLQMQDGKLQLRNRKINGKDATDGSLALNEISLQHLANFVQHFPIGQKIDQMLTTAAPEGKLRDFSLEWQGTPKSVETYRLRTQFSQLAMSANGNIPGFSGLSGQVEADQNKGTLTLASNQSQLDLKKVLRWPLPVDKLAGQISWQKNKSSLQIKIADLAVENAHLAGIINATYQHGEQGLGNIDLTAKLQRADGRYARYYYPSLLSEGTLHWLDTSILGGRGENVDVIVKGDLDKFPWDSGRDGLFQITAKISEGVLHYADRWPQIDDIKLDMLFRGNRMELNATQGRIYGKRIVKAKAVIPQLHTEHPVLEITGQAQGPANDMIKFINASPLLEFTDHFTQNMQAGGNGRLALGLRIPLDSHGEGTRVKGSYTLSEGELYAHEAVPPLKKINGQLQFTESSLSADNVRATAYDNPLQFTIKSGQNGLLSIRAQGRMNELGLRQIVKHPLTEKIYGNTDWNANVEIRQGVKSLTLASSLDGLSVALPAPFGKSPDESRPLRIESKAQDAARDLITIAYGNTATGALLRTTSGKDSRIQSGEINFGGRAVLPQTQGIRIVGKLDYVDWDQWQELADDKDNGQNSNISNVELDIKALDIFGRRINQLKLDARPVSDGWIAAVDSSEINGDVTWQDKENGKVVARLRKLFVPSPAPAKISAPDAEPASERNYPALDIIADQFEYKQKKLGGLEMLASQQGADWNIDKFILSNPDSRLSLSGTWQNWRRRPNTRLNVNWQIDHLGNTLDRFGYTEIMKGGNATFTGQLRWPGSPHEFDVAKLSGKLQVDAREGQFLKIKPGVGRLFSVLSLQNLPRRLLLDFSDVFSSGFAFTSVGGTATINQGVMQSDDFTMVGASALVKISGQTDLHRETQNLHIEVTPSISDSLSLAAFAGGPAVGVAAIIAQKILQDPFSKLVSYAYDVTGTWDEPKEVKSSKKKVAPAAQDKSLPPNN